MSKQQADELKKINIFWLKNNGFLIKGKNVCSGVINWRIYGSVLEEELVSIFVIRGNLDTKEEKAIVRLQYAYFDPKSHTKEDMDYLVDLTTTPCFWGSKRYWFLCFCGRRCAVLYSVGKYFCCRKCANVSYISQVRKRNPRAKLYRYESEINQREKNIRRRYYRGKPTRKYKQILKKSSRICSDGSEIEGFLHKLKKKIGR